MSMFVTALTHGVFGTVLLACLVVLVVGFREILSSGGGL